MDRYDTLGQLRQLPDLAAEVWMTKGHKNPSDRPLVASRSPFPKCPADLEVIDCLTRDEHDTAPLYTLTQAVRAVWEDLDAGQRPALTNPPTWSSETQWLLCTAETWQADPWLSEFVADQVWMVWRELARAARIPTPIAIGCPQPGCQGRVVESAGGWLTCTDCARQYPGSQRIVADFRRRPPMTTAQVSEWLGVTENAILVRRSHGRKLRPVNPGCKPLLWSPWDVLSVFRPDLIEALEQPDIGAA